MKKVLLILAALLCGCFALKAQDFTSEGLNYRVTGTNPPTVELTGHTEGFAAHDFVIPSTVDYGSTTYSVTSIGDWAFQNYPPLTGSLTIPNSVTSIGREAFIFCEDLTGTLTIGNSVTSIGNGAFFGCTNLTGSITIPNSVTSIEIYAFYNCSSLTGSLTIGSSVTSIGDYAFQYCSGFTGPLTIGSSVTSIGNNAFEGCSGFNGSLTIGSSVTSIGNSAFKDCSGFTGNLIIPNSVTSIGNSAFEGCSGFTGELILGMSVVSIGDYAFKNNQFSQIVAKPGRIPATGTDAFYGISELQSVFVPCDSGSDYEESWSGLADKIEVNFVMYDRIVASSNPDYGSVSITQYSDCVSHSSTVTATPAANCMFRNWTENGVVVSTANPYTFTLERDCNLVANFFRNYDFADNSTDQTLYFRITDAEQHTVSIVAPNSDDWQGWKNFTKPEGDITLPETVRHNSTDYTVTAINSNAFYKCEDLTGDLDIPNSVTSIGDYAFYQCSGFNGSLTIPNSVTSIGHHAFTQCSFTGSLIIPNSVTSIEDYTFNECSGFTGSLTIPNSVTSIGQHAFERCSGFNGPLTIGNAVTSIGQVAFNGCSGFTGTLTIGSSVTSIEDYAFFGCSGFTHIIAKPAAPPTLGTGVFEGVTGLQSITVPCDKSGAYSSWSGYAAITEDFVYDLTVASASTELGSASITQQADCGNPQATVTAEPNDGYKFVNWTENGVEVSTTTPYTFTLTSDRNLVANFFKQYDFSAACETGQTLYYRIIDADRNWVSIVAPNGDNWSSWDDYTKPAGDITLPETVEYDGTNYTVTAIGDCSLFGCDGLTGSLTIPNSVTSIGIYAISGCSGFTGSLTIGSSVTSIEECAFQWCSGLTGSLTIPNSVTSIGDDAFQGCSGFTGSLTIGSSVTSIGNGAFIWCYGFTGSLTIGSSVENIGWLVFDGCSFDNIISKASNAPSLADYIPCVSNKVYIPTGALQSYQSNWGSFEYNFIEYDREDYHFNGTGNEWNTAANWEENEVPTRSCPTVFINADCQVNTNAEVGTVIVAAGKTLTVNEGYIFKADGFTLENGAQLVNNGTVNSSSLTVKKDIAGYGTDTGGWHLVSSPVGKIGIPSGMRTNLEENYDLYRFEQTGDGDGNEWINAKFEESHGSDFFLDNQSGYLYANKNNTTIIFRGVFADTGAKTLEYVEGVDFPGFNLVGNPYPCNATISGTNLRSSNYFYKMNADGTALEVIDNPVIAPCTGVFAVANGSNATVKFAKTNATANVTRGEKSSLKDIRVELLANGKVIDRAFLNMNGESLPKFSLLDNTSEICFYQNKEELAVASTSSARGEMPLNFKAAKNGSYTITVNTENVDAEYLHLIDNLTGNDVDLLGDGTGKDAPWRVSTYTFDAKTSDYASRFKLVFSMTDTSTGSVSDSFAFISNGEIVISNEGRATLQVIDVLGRIVSSEEINGDCRISTNGLTAGLYILNLDGVTQKIVVE